MSKLLCPEELRGCFTIKLEPWDQKKGPVAQGT